MRAKEAQIETRKIKGGRKPKATNTDFFKDFLGISESEFIAEYRGLEKYQDIEAWKTKTGYKIKDYATWLEKKHGYLYSTARQRAYEINGYLKRVHGIKGIEVPNLPPAPPPDNNGRDLSVNEISRLYHACDRALGEHCKLMSLVEWGLRPSDLLRLKRSEIKEQFEVDTKKEKVVAHLSTTKELLEEFREYWSRNPNSDFAFNGFNGNEHLTEAGLNKMLARLCRRANVEPTGITAKTFRKWVWTTLKKLGVPEDERCYYIGKANDKSHDTYSTSWKNWYPNFAQVLSEIRKVQNRTIDATEPQTKALVEYLNAVRQWAIGKGFADFPTPPSIVVELLSKGDTPQNSIKPLFIV